MTEAEKHAKRRLKEAINYVSRHWGNGFNILSDSQRQALVRAEMLADISRISSVDTDPEVYKAMVSAMADAAVQWEGTVS